MSKVTTVRAKFTCTNVQAGNNGEAKVLMRAVTNGPGNEAWSKYTPWGELQMAITNPAAVEAFREGADYYLDITAVADADVG